MYEAVHYISKRLTGASAIMEFDLCEFHTRKSFRQSYNASRHGDLLLLLLVVTAAATIRVPILYISFEIFQFDISECSRTFASRIRVKSSPQGTECMYHASSGEDSFLQVSFFFFYVSRGRRFVRIVE